MQIESTSSFELIKSKLARSLKESLALDCETPRGEKRVEYEVRIPYHQLRADEEHDNMATALVTFAAWLPEEKTHTVRIRFEYTKSGKFLRETMTYV